MTILYYAIVFHRTEIIPLLLDHGAQIYYSSQELDSPDAPVRTAIQYNLPCILKMFLDHADKINLRLPLRELVATGISCRSEECTTMILQQGYYPHLGRHHDFLPISC